MRKNKLAIVIALALALSLGLAFASWANPFGMWGHQGQREHWGHKGKFANLTPEQAGQLFDLRQKFMDDTASLRKDMVVKKAELRALWRADNPDEKQILAKLKERNAVRDKFLEKLVPFRLQVKKLIPKAPGPQACLEDDDLNPGTTMAMEFSGPGDPGL